MTKRPTDSGLPRNSPRDDTLEGIAHTHPHGDTDLGHLHRLGNIDHDHDDDGRPIFKGPGIDQHGMVADGQYVEVPDPTVVEPFSKATEIQAAVDQADVDAHLAKTPDLAVASPPRDGQEADPPATPSVGDTLKPSHVADHPSAGSGGGSGRPLTITPGKPLTDEEVAAIKADLAQRPPAPGRSIGRVIANTAIDAALGVPVAVQDERAHAREAVEILVEAAADHHRHNRPMPAERLLDLEAVVAHMVEARGLRGGS